MIRVIVDTREQRPFEFREARVTRRALPEGDYQLLGDAKGLVIERKSVEDLFGTVAKDLDRFRREMERLSYHAFPVLLVEGLPEAVAAGARYSQANGHRVLDHALALCITYGVAPVFCHGRTAAQDMAWRLLKARAQNKERACHSPTTI